MRMRKRIALLAFAALAAAAIAGCAVEGADAEHEAEVNADFEAVMAAVGTEGAAEAFAAFDAKYGTELRADFAAEIAEARFGGGTDYPELTDMPFNVDGAVYLSGGSDDLAGSVIGWVAPKSLPGGYFHGAVLDLEKKDPNNEDVPCLQTAIVKGAGYETVNDWQTKINACVLNQAFAVNETALDSAQTAMDYYCSPSNTNMAYGFFKGYVNIFNVVTKEDNYWWYCTKTVWRMYNAYGVNLDSNSPQVDFTSSGLYSLVKAYYTALYFWSPSKAKAAINAYIADARAKIVMSEEIMLSPYLSKVYEAIRE